MRFSEAIALSRQRVVIVCELTSPFSVGRGSGDGNGPSLQDHNFFHPKENKNTKTQRRPRLLSTIAGKNLQNLSFSPFG